MHNPSQTFVLRIQGNPAGEALRFKVAADGTLTLEGAKPEKMQVLRRDSNGFMTVLWNQRIISGVVSREGEQGGLLKVTSEGGSMALKLSDANIDALEAGLGAAHSEDGSIDLTTPIPGLVKAILFALDAQVEAGQTVVVLEAMKMENDIVAPHKGTLAAIAVKPGQAVAAGAVLATIKISL